MRLLVVWRREYSRPRKAGTVAIFHNVVVHQVGCAAILPGTAPLRVGVANLVGGLFYSMISECAEVGNMNRSRAGGHTRLFAFIFWANFDRAYSGSEILALWIDFIAAYERRIGGNCRTEAREA